MNKVTFVGHATVLIETGGIRILTDPFLRSTPGHLKRESGPVSPDLIEGIDLVLISHHHQDHLDFKSLKMIGPDVDIIGCPETERLLKKKGFKNVSEINEGEEIDFFGVNFKGFKAVHGGGRRMPFKRTTGQAIGYLIGSEKKVYFAGDTDLFPGMADLASEQIDVSLLPIWGWGPNLGPGHLNPEKAAEAVKMIKPKIAIPIHWGTYFPRVIKKGRETLVDRGEIFKKEADQLAPFSENIVLKPSDFTYF